MIVKLHYSDADPYFIFNIGRVMVVTMLPTLPNDLRTLIEPTLGFPVQ